MHGLGFRVAALVVTALALGACREEAPETSLVPPDYSPHYTKLSVVSEDGRTKRVLVPEACLTPDSQSPADDPPARLPPGCANNYNLQRMAERERDLTQGRALGPAPAAPAARAAQRYIDGRPDPAYGGGVREEQGSEGSAGAPAAAR